MFSFKSIIVVSLLVSSTTTAFFLSPTLKSSSLTTSSARTTKTALKMSDTKKRMGKSVIGTTLPEIPNELEIASPFFQRTPPGTGMDERSPMALSDSLTSIESEKISNIYRSLRQNSLKMVLESNNHGSVDKLNRITQAITTQSLLPEFLIAGQSKVSCLSAGGLFDDWNSAIDL